MSKKTAILLIVIILLAVLGGVFYFLKKPKTSSTLPANLAPMPVTKPASFSGAPNQPVERASTTPVDKASLPERFPSDIPLEAGAALTLNYNAVNSAGQFQASREFISKKTLAQNFTLYQNSLKALGWTITSVSDQPSQKLIFAVKGGNNLNIRIYQDGKQVKVSLTNLTQP